MEKYKNKHCYTDFDEMLKNERIDILDICLPTYLHAEFAIKAMNMGINVICEKPVSLNAADVARVYSTAKSNNVKFMVAQVLRFWPEYSIIKEIYNTGKYGRAYGQARSSPEVELGRLDDGRGPQRTCTV